MFLNATDHRNLPHHVQNAHCELCHTDEWTALAQVPCLTGDGNLVLHGQIYHLNDFVYLAPDDTAFAEVFVFGQIVKFNTTSDATQIHARVFDVQAPPDSGMTAP